MKPFFPRLQLNATLVTVALCAIWQINPEAVQAQAPKYEQFRIGMRIGYGPHTPKTPLPPHGSSQWNDVAEWQHSLKGHGYLTSGNYLSDNFDRPTEVATKAFQTANGLPASGIVTWATYSKAFGIGGQSYAIVPPSRVSRSRGSCHLRYPMGVGCRDSGLYRDVSDWQTFLVDIGYLGGGYLNGSYDFPTKGATKKFQSNNHLNPTGIVDLRTIHAAEHVGRFSCTPMHLPCP